MNPPSHLKPDHVLALTEIWRKVLAKPSLDEDSNVFEIGGSSLHVLQVAGQIYEVLGTDVKLRDVFSHATPRSLATFLDGEAERGASDTEGTNP
ncbi:phosphopantetheine-binding protein [Nonomuraea fuscirosea]|uniref:phosphopantetheine-binding protein n=1 Tax=Nonomuraea fuscirosea TaxID=1291556 RepID=UPI003444E900